MNAYFAADMDHDAHLAYRDEADAILDYIRDVFDEAPDHCHRDCPFKDVYGACTTWQRWPDCKLMELLSPPSPLDRWPRREYRGTIKP